MTNGMFMLGLSGVFGRIACFPSLYSDRGNYGLFFASFSAGFFTFHEVVFFTMTSSTADTRRLEKFSRITTCIIA